MPRLAAVEQLPVETRRLLDEIRKQQFDNIAKALPELYRPGKVKVRRGNQVVQRDWNGLRAEVRVVVARIQASGYARDVADRELRKLTAGHYSRLRGVLVGQLRDAIEFAGRYDDLITHYHATERLRLKAKPIGVELFNTREAAFLNSVESLGSAEAAMLWAAKRRAQVVHPERVILRKHRVPMPKGGSMSLSEYLHGKAAAESREMGRIVSRAIREGQSLDEASRVLIDAVKRGGGQVAANKDLPAVLRKLQRAGAELAEGAGPEAWEQWEAAQARVERYMRAQLRHGGRVYKGYLEVLQDIRAKGPQNLQKALDKWLYQWQRYAGERILNTETQAAFRIRQFEHDKRRPWIKRYRLEMNRALHGQYAARTPRRKSGKMAGRRCECEAHDGKTWPAAYARKYTHGFHPHCGCRWVPVVDRVHMQRAPIQDDELEWLEEFAGEI